MYEVIHHMPLATFCSDLRSWEDCNATEPICSQIFSNMVSSSVRRVAGTSPANLLGCEERVDKILEVEAHAHIEHVKVRYLCEIDTYLKQQVPRTVLASVTRGIGYRRIEPPQESILQLSTAAAVGSLAAVKHLLGTGTVWPSQQYLKQPAEDLFASPLRAAISTGKVGVVSYLLEQLDCYLENPSPGNQYPIRRSLHTAINIAIKAEQPKIILILYKYACDHHHGLTLQSCCYAACPRLWVESAVKTGRVDICRTVLHILPLNLRPGSSRHTPDMFALACEHNQLDIARWIFRRKRGTYSIDLPQALRIAASLPSLALLDLLLDYGADINEDEPIQFAIVKGHTAMMKEMVQRGARLTDKTFDRVNEQLGQIKYAGLRSFGTDKSHIAACYYAAKSVGQYNPKTVTNYMELLVHDVDDSKEWSAKVAELFETMVAVPREASGARLFGEYLLESGF